MMRQRWSEERAQDWLVGYASFKGCNYLPRTAVNVVEMWQGETFNPATIDEELRWAGEIGLNAIRVYLPFVVWEADRDGLKQRFDQLLAIADKHRIHVMPVLFDDCAFSGNQPQVGRQAEPVPGVHNSGWVPSPSHEIALDASRWAPLELYVKDMIGAFKSDGRISVWDLYNEPGASDMGERTMPLVRAAFEWAREMEPAQPLTVGCWLFSGGFDNALNTELWGLSDVLSFHYYGSPEDEQLLRFLASHRGGRPLFCTEWLHRPNGNTCRAVIPLFAQHGVGWYTWGLVAGRIQTYLHWNSDPGTPVPQVWQHDLLHADGKPYDSEEIRWIIGERSE